MLEITIPDTEVFDEIRNEFVYVREQTLRLEHSLVSLSKWESKWHKPFLTKQDKTLEETIDYIRCMTVTHNVDPTVYMRLTDENVEQVNAYIEDPATGHYIYEDKKQKGSSETVTSELIYYWLISLNIPFECQKWHLNKLLTLIKVCSMKNNPKKMSKKEIMERNAALNAQRRAKYNTKG